MVTAFALIALGLIAGDWDNLKEITRDRDYTVVLRDGRCINGRLVASDEHQVTMDSGVAGRSEVLRISDDRGDSAHNAVFSGRSSWADVMAAGPRGSEYLQIVEKGGQQLKWKRPLTSADSIFFAEKRVAKNEVRTISYVRFKPITPFDEYASKENAVLLAPRLWFGGLFVGKIVVTLFDSAAVEENSNVSCRTK